MGISDKTGREGSGPKKWKSNAKTISWGQGPSESIRDCIGRVTDTGAAILFTRTPDGGALVLKVYSGGEQSKEYVTEPSDFIPLLTWVVETYG